MANNLKKYANDNTLLALVAKIKELFATKSELSGKADSSHAHTIANVTNLQSSLDSKVPTSRTINSKPLSANITLSASDVGAAASSHTHDDRYYTESEIDTKLASKANSSHNHDSAYDAKGSASAVKENLDTVSDTLDAHTTNTNIHVTTTNKSNWNSAYTHSTSAHARTDATKVADSSTNGNILINGAETNVYSHPNSGVTAGTYKSVTVNAQGHITGGSNPTTLSGYGITDAESKGAASSALASAKEYTDTVASGKADTDHNHDSAYDSKGSASSALASAKTYADSAATTAANKVKNDLLNGAGTAFDTLKELGDLIVDNQDAIDALETVASGKADAVHTHVISDVSGLQSALDGKAASSHGTHVSYSTTAPVMDGTASAGSASTVARSDHKHPTDTSRASKTEFDTHTANTTVHITSTERSNWNIAKTHADSAHAPSNAQPNQNAFSNVKVGSTIIAADTTTDTLELVGSNVTITPDATNDKVTISVADASTSAKGIVQLTNSTASTSTTTAATPSSVKSAYDLANTAKTNAATAQERADSAYILAESKVDSLSDLGITATAAELNYMDGVTSNVQAQLDGKANTIHIHPYGVCSSLATYTTKTVTVDNFSLVEGARVIVKFTNANSASSPKLNVNSTGAIPIMRYGTTAAGSNTTTNGWEAGAVLAFTYDGTNWVQDYWYNTTYTNASLGQGYGTCYTSSSTAEKTVSMSNYEDKTGGVVSIKFTYSVDAGATLNINSQGAMDIYYKGSAIVDDVIKGGDIATFICSGSTYHLISVDRWFEDIAELQANDRRVRQMPTSTNGNFRLLLTPSSQSADTTAYTYFDNDVYLNPYYNKIYGVDISGNAGSADKLNTAPVSATLSASSWSNLTQTVSVSGVTASNTVIITPAPSSHTSYCASGVYCSAQASGTLTFTCTEKPTSALTVNVLILN